MKRNRPHSPQPRAARDRKSRLWEKALTLHREILTLDTHADTPLVFLKQPFDLAERQAAGHVDLPRLRAGMLRAQFFAAYTPPRFRMGEGALNFGMRMLDAIHQMIERHPADLELARHSSDFSRIAGQGKIAIAIGMENGEPIERNLANLRNFHRLGVRYLTLTHWFNNHLGDSSTDEAPLWHGLSDFGREVVRECNRLGIMIDVSHVHDEVVKECLELSTAPLVATHSNARALCDHPRNLSDELLRQIAEAGGVIQVNFCNDFLSQPHCDNSRAYEAEDRRLRHLLHDEAEIAERMQAWRAAWPPPPRPPLSVVGDHIAHIVRITGSVEHVGIGSDFDGVKSTPQGLDDVSAMPKLTCHLLERGFSEDDLRKIWGENLLRVMAAAERTAGVRTNG